MATREALAKLETEVHAAIERITAAVTELGNLAGEALEGPTDVELAHAREYADTAALLRRRATKASAAGDRDLALEHHTRADWFEARALAVRSGGPMPPELRTPAESLDRVHHFRAALVGVIVDHADVTDAELEAFRRALSTVRTMGGPRLDPESWAPLERASIAAAAAVLLKPFGVRRALGVHVFERYASPHDGGPDPFASEPPTKSETRPPPTGGPSLEATPTRKDSPRGTDPT